MTKTKEILEGEVSLARLQPSHPVRLNVKRVGREGFMDTTAVVLEANRYFVIFGFIHSPGIIGEMRYSVVDGRINLNTEPNNIIFYKRGGGKSNETFTYERIYRSLSEVQIR